MAAWDATQRGLSVAIIDKVGFRQRDLVQQHAKTLHGGVRALMTSGNVTELRQFVRERRAHIAHRHRISCSPSPSSSRPMPD